MTISEQQVSFHDASIVGISSTHNVLHLLVEDVSVGQSKQSMTVTVNGIESLTRDDLPLAMLKMETDDGEILDFNVEGNVVTLVVTWYQHSPRSQDTHVYRIFGKEIRIGQSIRENSQR